VESQRQQKGAVVIILILIIVIVGVGYLIISSSLPRKDKDSRLTSPGNLLETACQKATGDYPEWTNIDSDLVIWQTLDKSFKYRNSPEEPSVGIDSPVSNSETLIDMDFVGANEISYVKNQGNKWQIGFYKLNGMNPPDNSLVYENSEPFAFIDISPINKSEFIVFLANGNNGHLKYLDINNSKEEDLSKLPFVNNGKSKLAVSPKGTYVYLLHNKTLTLFDINSKKQIDKIGSVESIVWLGDSYLLYANQEATFVYDVKTKKENQLDKMDSISDLSFNPKDGGVLAYTQGSSVQVRSCAISKIISSKENARFRTLASDKTVIMEKEDFFGFWRFKNDWTVTFIEKDSNVVTVWQRY